MKRKDKKMNGTRLTTDDRQIIAYSNFKTEEILHEIRQEKLLNHAGYIKNLTKIMQSARLLIALLTALIVR